MLEAVLAAEDHLIVVREGHDVRTNQAVPRAVPTAELYESLLASVETGHRLAVARRLEIDHPRQPYDERCFAVGALVAESAWGFDRNELAGALARRDRSNDRVPFLDGPLEPVPSDVIELSALHGFFRNPAAAFFSARLEARLPRPEDENPTALAVDVTGLNGWAVGSRLLEARQAGRSFASGWSTNVSWGRFPLRRWARTRWRPRPDGRDHARRAIRPGWRPGPAVPFPVDALLPDGTRVVGSVPLRLAGPATPPDPAELTIRGSSLTHRVAAWLDLMALAADGPDRGGGGRWP